jgi:Uma2 family endonuclease
MATISGSDVSAINMPIASFVALRGASGKALPFLEPGDRLSAAEFLRRYETMPEVNKAQLVEGVVFMPSPVRMSVHGAPHADLIAWLAGYRAATPGVNAGDNATVIMDNDNVPQPDCLLMIDSQLGGQASIDSKGYIENAPELVAEIASSSASIDRHAKLNVYRRNGVREYIVWRVLDRAIDWFVLREGQFMLLTAGDDGVIHSEVFPGLWLNAAALLDGKLNEVLATLQQGLATAEHQEFVRRIAGQQKE